MIDLQDLGYAVTQVVHNFGAATVVGGAAFMLYMAPLPASLQRKFAWLAGFGWGAQVLSGMGFGAISHYYYGKFPDIHGIASPRWLLKCCAQCLHWPWLRCICAMPMAGRTDNATLCGKSCLRWVQRH